MFRVDKGRTVHYRLLIHTLKNRVVPDESVMRNVVSATGVTWYGNLCLLVPNISEQDCQCSIVMWNVCAFLYIRPNLMVTYTSTCHILLNIQYIHHFWHCCISGQKNKIFIMTCRVNHVVVPNLGFESLDWIQLAHSRVMVVSPQTYRAFGILVSFILWECLHSIKFVFCTTCSILIQNGSLIFVINWKANYGFCRVLKLFYHTKLGCYI
jgi:hypothetical protein